MLCVLGHLEDHLGERALHETESFLSYPCGPTFMNNPWELEKTSHKSLSAFSESGSGEISCFWKMAWFSWPPDSDIQLHSTCPSGFLTGVLKTVCPKWKPPCFQRLLIFFTVLSVAINLKIFFQLLRPQNLAVKFNYVLSLKLHIKSKCLSCQICSIWQTSPNCSPRFHPVALCYCTAQSLLGFLSTSLRRKPGPDHKSQGPRSSPSSADLFSFVPWTHNCACVSESSHFPECTSCGYPPSSLQQILHSGLAITCSFVDCLLPVKVAWEQGFKKKRKEKK